MPRIASRAAPPYPTPMTQTAETALPPVRHFTVPNADDIAYRHQPGDGPTIVFLPGYMSDMEGGKATRVMADAMAKGRACLLLDYAGCGQSGGDFADGTLSCWCAETIALLDHVAGGARSGPVLLVGSSMGGWLMLMIARALVSRGGDAAVAGMVGIAAAPDFTDWGFDDSQKAALAAGETVFEENNYGYDPMPTHARFWRDGQAQRMLGDTIALSCPTRLLHGQDDPEVPVGIALRLAERLEGGDVRITLVKGGDHRLSRESDIALLLATLDELAG